MSRIAPIRWTLAALALLALAPAPVAAQWYTARLAVGEEGAMTDVATVDNESGHRFHLYRSGEAQLRGLLTIPESYDRLSPDTCPTWHVDKRFVAATGVDVPCRMGHWHADFAVAEIDGRRVYSTELDRVMKGRRLVFRYRIEGAGYRETSFGLRGSRRRIQAILGERVRVVTSR